MAASPLTETPVTNNRFRAAQAPQSLIDTPFAGSDVSVEIASPKTPLGTVHEEDTNGHVPASPACNVKTSKRSTRGAGFSFKQVGRNISKQFSLDDFDWDAAKRRNEQIEQIALNDEEEWNMPPRPQNKWEKAWMGFIRTLSDTFLIARLSLNLIGYLGVGELPKTWYSNCCKSCMTCT